MLLLCGITFSACAGAKGSLKKASGSNRTSGGILEDFNPADLDDDDIQITEELVGGSPSNQRFDQRQIASTDTIGSGYRVQIIQTTDPDEAREFQKDAILRFEQDVYLVFNAPYYKVRVGDFVNWEDAEKTHQLAQNKGFRDAWVIRTKVNLKKAYQAADLW